jgi:hypothetical protein
MDERPEGPQRPPRRWSVPSWPLWGTLALNLCFIAFHGWKLWQGAPAVHLLGIVLHLLASGCLWGLHRLARGA